jgi:hypothetical protein
MKRQELIALMPGKGPPEAPPGCRLVAADGHVAVLAKPRVLSLARRTDMIRAAADRARILEALLPHGTVLPVLHGQRIGECEVHGLVAANTPVLAALAERLGGRVQYQVTVRWSAHAAADKFGLPGSDGEEVSLAGLAANLRTRIGERLARTGAELLSLPVAGDVLSNLAILIADGAEAALDAAVEDIDAIWSEGFAIRMVGPYPGVTFGSLVFDRVDGPAIRAALAAFSLSPGFSGEALRAARRAVLMRAEAERHEALRRQADLLACVARIDGMQAPLHVARIWSEGMSTAAGPAVRAA